MNSFEYANENQIKNFRPIPFYFITTTDPNELSYEAVRESMMTLKEEGFGGIVLFNKPPHGFGEKDYLGDAWFDMIRNFAKVCKELELKLWINDALNYPPGSAGGRINRKDYPHLAPKRLVLLDGEVTSAEVDWGFPAFELPESAELFHKIVHEAYLREVGEYFGDPIHSFTYRVDENGINTLKLYISKRHTAAISALTLDGEALSDKEDTFVLDDPYYCLSLEKGKAVGTHTIVLETTKALTEFDNILLQGDFGVDVHSEEPYTLFCANQYNLDKYLPKEAEVVLTKRPATLKTTVSWANQGHPFYSGKATYCFKLDLPQDFGEAMLCIPQVHTGCDITLDQKAIGQRIFLPYTFELGDMSGSHDLLITVSNTMANALEFYKAPSGISAGVYLEKVDQ